MTSISSEAVLPLLSVAVHLMVYVPASDNEGADENKMNGPIPVEVSG